MKVSRVMHMQAYLRNNIGDIRMSKSEILQSTSDTAVVSRIRHRRTISGRQLGVSVHRSAAGLAVTHASAVQDIQQIMSLGKKHAIITTLNSNTRKMLKGTHVCHREFMSMSGNNLLKETLGRSREHNIINIEKKEGHLSAPTVKEQ